jgi:hypothetical protein
VEQNTLTLEQVTAVLEGKLVLGTPGKTPERFLDLLGEAGRLVRIGPAKGGRWEVTDGDRLPRAGGGSVDAVILQTRVTVGPSRRTAPRIGDARP